jgi:hypothetical protein
MTTVQQARPRRRTSLFPAESSPLAVALGAVFLTASAAWMGVGGVILHRVL